MTTQILASMQRTVRETGLPEAEASWGSYEGRLVLGGCASLIFLQPWLSAAFISAAAVHHIVARILHWADSVPLPASMFRWAQKGWFLWTPMVLGGAMLTLMFPVSGVVLATMGAALHALKSSSHVNQLP